MVKPLIVTVLAVPAFLLLKVPVAPVTTRITTSPVTTPVRTAPPVLSVAAVVPLYTLLFTVTPEIVRAAEVIFAVASRLCQ